MPFPVVELVAVRRSATATPPVPRPATGRMTITPEGAAPIVVPYAPRDVEHGGLGGEYVTVARPGLPSLVVYQNEQVPTMSFTLLIADKAETFSAGRFDGRPATTALAVIDTLASHARRGTRVRVTYGRLESGPWHITGLSVRSVHRDAMTDEIVRAEVDVAMTRVSTVVDGVGPLTGGVQHILTPAPTPPRPASLPGTARYYTMKRGDTLWAVSLRFYGTGTRWTALADANRITNVRAIPVGTTIRIP